MPRRIKTYLILLFASFTFIASAQDRFDVLKSKLEQASIKQTGLNKTVNISVNNYTLKEVIRAIAQENNLNISIDPSILATPSYNFTNAKVKDVFLLLCKEHNLTLEWTGEIISFKPYIEVKEEPKPKPPKTIQLTYNQSDSTLSGTLYNDTMLKVIQKISLLTKVNIDVQNELKNELVSMTIVSQNIEEVIARLAGDNDFTKIASNFYKIVKASPEENVANGRNTRTPRRRVRNNTSSRSQSSGNEDFDVQIKDSLISVEAEETDLKALISEICNQSNHNYFLFDEPKGKITVKTRNLNFEETLTYLLNTSDFTFRKIDNIYIIGDRKKEKFRHTESFQFQYRTIEGIVDIIPDDLKKDIKIIENSELNALILSGSLPQISELRRFLLDIDKIVPMILIEVMIVDINKTKSLNTGLSVGTNGNENTTGSFNNNSDQNNGVNVNLNTNTLNRIISSINNLGYFNLGEISNGFYVSMNALESHGNIKIVSTPKLAALNGHEAEMSIGETTYYQEPQTNVIGTQNPQTVQSVTYKPLNADLSLSIKPVVSGDDQITLEITVSQSNFTTRADPNAPPGSQKREFKSIIRMKNKEMVVLGGLDNSRKEKTSAGIPILGRIPVLKWLFGKQSNQKNKSELTIFIRPTVIQ